MKEYKITIELDVKFIKELAEVMIAYANIDYADYNTNTICDKILTKYIGSVEETLCNLFKSVLGPDYMKNTECQKLLDEWWKRRTI